MTQQHPHRRCPPEHTPSPAEPITGGHDAPELKPQAPPELPVTEPSPPAPSGCSWLRLPVPVEADSAIPLPGQQAGAAGGPAGQCPAPCGVRGQQRRAVSQQQVPHRDGARRQHGGSRSVLHITLQIPEGAHTRHGSAACLSKHHHTIL